MSRPTALLSFALLLTTVPLLAGDQETLVASARSAGPSSVSADATVINWKFEVVIEGTNEWTCLPDNPDTSGVDPWCVNDPWLNLLDELVNKKEPSYTEIGFADMRDFAAWGPDGVKLKPSEGIDADRGRAVAEVSETVTQHGGTVRFKLHDKVSALREIGRALGMFTDRLVIDDQECRRRLAALINCDPSELPTPARARR